jgi:predicted Zn-dependent protease
LTALDIAERALGLVDGEALVRVVRERSLMLRFAASRPTQATAIDDLTVELAVRHGGQVVCARTNRTDHDGLRACARRATDAAQAAAAAGPGTQPELALPATAPKLLTGAFDPQTAALDPEAGGHALAAAFAADAPAHGVWTAGSQEHAVADRSRGFAEATTDAYMKVICIDRPGGRSGFAAATARRAGDLDAPALAERAAAKLRVGGEQAELTPGRYPVVLEPHAVGELLELLGSSALNGLAHVEGRGALDGRLGRQVAASAVNLADSPRNPHTLPRGFDAEGTAKGPVPLIQDGVALRVVHDRRSAALAGTESTGHALAPGGDPHGPAPTNLVLAGGGAADVAELCEPIERGIYVTRLWYTNVVRPKETLVTGVTRDGTFLIEDGVVARPLRELRLSDSILGMLARVQALTAEQKLTSAGEFYGRRSASGVVCPALRVDAVRFTGPAG